MDRVHYLFNLSFTAFARKPGDVRGLSKSPERVQLAKSDPSASLGYHPQSQPRHRWKNLFIVPKSQSRRSAVILTKSPRVLCFYASGGTVLNTHVNYTSSQLPRQLPMTTTTRPELTALSLNGSAQSLNSLACNERGL